MCPIFFEIPIFKGDSRKNPIASLSQIARFLILSKSFFAAVSILMLCLFENRHFFQKMNQTYSVSIEMFRLSCYNTFVE